MTASQGVLSRLRRARAWHEHRDFWCRSDLRLDDQPALDADGSYRSYRRIQGPGAIQ